MLSLYRLRDMLSLSFSAHVYDSGERTRGIVLHWAGGVYYSKGAIKTERAEGITICTTREEGRETQRESQTTRRKSQSTCQTPHKGGKGFEGEG
jgi:hypothetical protein